MKRKDDKMHEMEDFENLLIEYGQMPGGAALQELYNLNQMKCEDKKEKRPFFMGLAQMWSWA